MQDTDIYNQLQKVFNDVFDEDSIVLKSTTSAEDIVGWDSFNHINLVLAIELAFEVKFSSKELERMQSVGDMVTLLKEKDSVKVRRA